MLLKIVSLTFRSICSDIRTVAIHDRNSTFGSPILTYSQNRLQRFINMHYLYIDKTYIENIRLTEKGAYSLIVLYVSYFFDFQNAYVIFLGVCKKSGPI